MAVPGRLHVYHPRKFLTLFEFTPLQHELDSRQISFQCRPSRNVLLFIGGLYDNFLSVPYLAELAALFPSNGATPPQWTVMQVQLSSSGTGWGLGSLDKDVEQIGVCVEYIRQYVKESSGGRTTSAPQPPEPGANKDASEDINIVLMGHSTGCQDVLHYIYSSPAPTSTTTGRTTSPSSSAPPPRNPPIQGAILQAPVSDREALLHHLSLSAVSQTTYIDLLAHISTIPESQWDRTTLPMSQTYALALGPAPISIARFMSLASPESPNSPRPDDLFSSDLTDRRLKQTFGRVGISGVLLAAKPTQINRRMLILISGADQHVPSSIDKSSLLARWKAALEEAQESEEERQQNAVILDESSAVVDGATHALDGDSEVQRAARSEGIERVHAYLRRVLEGSNGRRELAEEQQQHCGEEDGSGLEFRSQETKLKKGLR